VVWTDVIKGSIKLTLVYQISINNDNFLLRCYITTLFTLYTGRFIMFSVITNIYNKKTKGPTLMELFTATRKPNKFFLQLEMFDVCTAGDTAHIDMLFKFLSHTRQHACIDILHTLASPSGRNVNYDEKQLSGKKVLSCSFCLYRFRKYMCYGFPIINICNPGVRYETTCIFHEFLPVYSPYKSLLEDKY
jgi:hypothetical protein